MTTLKNTERRKEYQKRTDRQLSKKKKEIEKTGTSEKIWTVFKNTIINTAMDICGKSAVNEKSKKTELWNKDAKLKITLKNAVKEA